MQEGGKEKGLECTGMVENSLELGILGEKIVIGKIANRLVEKIADVELYSDRVMKRMLKECYHWEYCLKSSVIHLLLN